MKWERVRLSELVSPVARRGPERGADQFTYVDLSSVDATSKAITSPTLIPTAEAPSRARQNLAVGDVLVSTVRPNLNGVAAVLVELDGAIGSTGFAVLRPTEAVDSRYLFHWVRTPEFVESMVRFATGASYPAVTDAIVKSSSIPLPPLPEQRRIAAILDEADTLRVSARRMTVLQSESLTAQFEALFPFSSGERTTIGALLQSTQYGTSEKAGATGAFPVLRMGNLTVDGRIDLSDMKYVEVPERDHDKYLVRAGDILFNRTNSADLVGKTAVYREAEPRAYAGYLVRLRPKSPAIGEFIAGYLNSRHGKRTLRRMAKSIVGMANINAKEVQTIQLPSPSESALDHYTAAVAAAQLASAAGDRRARSLDTLFASLQHRAFRGEL